MIDVPMSEARRRGLRFLPPAFCAALILTAATGVGSGDETGRFVLPFLESLGLGTTAAAAVHAALRSAGHIVAYAVFAVLLWRALRGSGHAIRHALLGACALALLDESIQALVPERTGDPVDVLLDGGGAALGLFLVAVGGSRAARY
ncbi:MAG: VanZ family protein [Planctomycetota bacterium]|jgi:VanZ family protein